MSQNDYTIANQGFPAFRSDLNSALQAIATNNSGATAPSTTFANMWWYDSANDILYIRNEDNDAWIKFAELDQTNDKFILSGTLQLDDGTVSAPALTFNSDTNMGLYRGGTDILKFVTAGTDRLTILANGDTGIGTSSPDYLVEVEKANGDHTGTAIAITNSQDGGYGSVLNFVSNRPDTGNVIASQIGTQGNDSWNSDASTSSNLLFSTVNANTLAERMRINSLGEVLIGTTTQGRETNLAVVGTDQLPTGAWSQFGIYSNDSYAINKGGSMMFGGQDGSVVRSFFASIKGAKENSTSGNYAGYLAFYTRPSDDTPREYMRITSSGRLLIGLTTGNGSDEALQVYRNGAPTLSVARQQDGTIVHFRVGSVDGAAHGSIDISGTTCSYNAFSGSHWSRLADNSKPTILKGTIIETIDEMCDWYQAEFTVEATTKEDTDSESETFGQQIEDVAEHIASKPIELPSGGAVGDTISVTSNGITYDNAVIAKEGDEKHVKCKISDTADSKKVYGVHRSWDSDDDTVNDMYVTAVGTHVVRINGSVTVSAGDLLASNGDGTAKVQDDDIIRSKTVGKVLTNIKQETYSDGSYTVPCALYCG
jgi:hypothetical protein